MFFKKCWLKLERVLLIMDILSYIDLYFKSNFWVNAILYLAVVPPAADPKQKQQQKRDLNSKK
jgi:hypothetical protein